MNTLELSVERKKREKTPHNSQTCCTVHWPFKSQIDNFLCCYKGSTTCWVLLDYNVVYSMLPHSKWHHEKETNGKMNEKGIWLHWFVFRVVRIDSTNTFKMTTFSLKPNPKLNPSSRCISVRPEDTNHSLMKTINLK